MSDQQIIDLLDKAEICVQEEQYKSAVRSFDKALAYEPDNIRAYIGQAMCYIALNQVKKALRCYDEVLKREPANPEALFNKASLLLLIEDKPDLAKPIYEKLLEKNTNEDSIISWLNVASAFASINLMEDALSLIDKLLQHFPKNTLILRQKGITLYNLGQVEQALKCFEEALEIDPNNKDVLQEKGAILIAMEQYKDALLCLKIACDIDKENGKLWSYKGDAFAGLGQWSDALGCYENSVNFDQNNIDYWIRKARALSVLESHADAVDSYEQALKISQSLDNVNVDIGSILIAKSYSLIELRRYSEAVETAQKAKNLNQKDPEPFLAEGFAWEKQGKHEDAERLYQKALKLDPDNYDTNFRLGFLYSEGLYNHRKALKYSTKLYDLDKKYFATYEAYCYDLISNKQYVAAQKIANEAFLVCDSPLEFCIARFLELTAGMLGHISYTNSSFDLFIKEFRKVDKHDLKNYVFGGLGHAIAASRADSQTKFVLLTLIDVLQGNIESSVLSFFSKFDDR